MQITKRIIAALTLLMLICSLLASCGDLNNFGGGGSSDSDGGNSSGSSGSGGATEGSDKSDNGDSDTPARPTITYLEIDGPESIKMEIGQTRVLIISQNEEVLKLVEWSIDGDAVCFDDDHDFGDPTNKFEAVKLGVATVTARYGALTDSVTITVVPVGEGDSDDGKDPSDDVIGGGSGDNTEDGSDDNTGSGSGSGGFDGEDDTIDRPGSGNGGTDDEKDDTGIGSEENLPEDDVIEITSDPYVGVSKSEFYSSYKPAQNYMDAYYRSQHGFLSGMLEIPVAAPTVSSFQPSRGGVLIRNTDMHYTNGGNTYVVYDAYGNEAFRVHKGGAYITLEEVAAYMFAFGGEDGAFPANYVSKKSPKPASSIWGEYLRANHSYFSGDTVKYPREPELPNIMGCGGSLRYWEMDIGTSGYNNGSKISRGACRIVYGRDDLNGNGIYEAEELHVFYTYNHYDDFQEYLNYAGGWGEIFGYQSRDAGSSKPSPYINVVYDSLTKKASPTVVIYPPFLDDKRYAA